MSNIFSDDDSLLEQPLFMRIQSQIKSSSESIKIQACNVVPSNVQNVTLDLDDSTDSLQVVQDDFPSPCKSEDLNRLKDLSIEITESLLPHFNIDSQSPVKLTKIIDKHASSTPIKSVKRKVNSDKVKLKASKEFIKQKEKVRKEVLKSKSQKQAHNHCYALIDQKIIELAADDIKNIFEENNFQYKEIQQLIPFSMTWIKIDKKISQENSNIESQANIEEEEVGQNHLLILIPSNDFIQKVDAFVSHLGETPFDFVKNVYDTTPYRNITLVLYKLNSYFKLVNSKSTNRFKSRFNQLETNSQSEKNTRQDIHSVTKDDVDLSIIDMEIKVNQLDPNFKVSIVYVNTPNDLASTIFRYTKSIAEQVARQEKSCCNFSWYAEADNKSTVDPKEPKDYEKLWKRQLMQFPKVSFDIANAIVEKYSTPTSLIDAFNQSNNPQRLLEDLIVVRKQASGSSSERRIGPEVARRIHLFMTSRDGDELINQ